MQNIEYLGITGGLLCAIAFLPQIIQIVKTKSAKDVSLTMYLIYTIGLIMWISYGYIMNSPAIMITNSISLMLSLVTIFVKLRWQK
jgi:MtN3 and saliva related transmembrane protein